MLNYRKVKWRFPLVIAGIAIFALRVNSNYNYNPFNSFAECCLKKCSPTLISKFCLNFPFNSKFWVLRVGRLYKVCRLVLWPWTEVERRENPAVCSGINYLTNFGNFAENISAFFFKFYYSINNMVGKKK